MLHNQGRETDTSSPDPFCKDRPSPALPTYRAAVEGGSDVRVVVVGHLLVVGPQEADRLIVAVGGGVVPGYGLVAVVSDVLVGRGTQEPEESHLHHSDGVPV